MKKCSVTVSNAIKEVAKKELETINSVQGPLKEGMVFTSMQYLDIHEELAQAEEKLGLTLSNQTEVGSNDLITIGIVVPDMVVNDERNIVSDTLNNRTTEVEEANYDKTDLTGLLKESIAKAFDDTEQERKTMFQTMSAIIEVISETKYANQIRELFDVEQQVVIDGKNVTFPNLEVLDRIKTLAGSITSQIDKEDMEGVLEQFINYIFEADIIAKNALSIMQEMEANVKQYDRENGTNKEEELYAKLQQVALTATSHKDIIANFAKYIKEDPADNELAKKIHQVLARINSIDNILIDHADKYFLNRSDDILGPEVKKKKAEKEGRLKKLEAGLAKAKAEGKKGLANIMQGDIDQLKKDLKDLLPTRDVMRRALRGQLGDIGNRWIQSATAMMSSKDPIIQTIAKAIAAIEGKIAKISKEWEDELGDRLKELQKSNKVGQLTNFQKYYEKMHESVPVYKFNRKKRTIGYDQPSFDSEGNPIEGSGVTIEYEGWAKNRLGNTHITRESAIELKQQLKTSELIQLHENTEDKSPENRIYHDKVLELRKQQIEIEEELRQFRVDTYKSTLSKEAQAIYDIRKQTVDYERDGRTYPRTAESFVKHIERERNNIYSKIDKLQQGIPLAEDIERLEATSRELAAMKVVTEDSLPWEIELARILNEYETARKTMYEWIPDAEKFSKFKEAMQIAKDKRDKREITPEEYKRFLDYHTQTGVTDEFQRIVDAKKKAMNDALDNMLEVLERKNLSVENYEEQKEVIRLARAELNNKLNSHRINFGPDRGLVNGQTMTELELEAVRNQELAIDNLKAMFDGISGITANDRAELNEASAKIQTLNKENEKLKKSNSNADQAQIDFNNKEKGNLLEKIKKINSKKFSKSQDAQIKKAKEDLDEATGEYYELFEFPTTHFYEKEFQKQLDLWTSNINLESTTTKFTVGAYTFDLRDGIWYRSKDGFSEVFTGNISKAFRNSREVESMFERSEWFINNHIERERFDGERMVTKQEPIRAWTTMRPSNPKHIDKTKPSIGWWSKKYKPEFEKQKLPYGVKLKREDAVTQADKDVWNDPTMSDADREFITWVTGKYLKAQEKYPKDRRMGYRLPSKEKAMGIFDTTSDDLKVETFKRIVGRTIKTTEADVDEKLGNKRSNFIPVRYSNKQLTADLVDTDLAKSFTDYILEAERYSLLDKELRPLISAAKVTLKNNKPKIEDVSENGIVRRFARKFGVDAKVRVHGSSSDTYNRLEAVENIEKMWLYGNKEERSEDAHITFGNTKVSYNLTKIGRTLLHKKSFFVLAGTTFSQLGNNLAGKINQIVETQSGVTPEYTLSNYLKAQKAWLGRYSWDYTRDIGKIGSKFMITNAMEAFDALNNEYISRVGKQSSISKELISNFLFMFQDAAELDLAATNFITLAMGYKLPSGRSLLEAIEEEQREHGTFNMPAEVTNEIFNDFRDKLHGINLNVNGAYRKIDKTELSRHFLGTVLEWMKKWLVTTIQKNWGGRGYLGTTSEIGGGIWRHGYSVIFKLLQVLYYENAMTAKDYWNDTLSPEEKGYVKQINAQILIAVAMMATVSQLFGFDDDDEDKYKKLADNGLATNALLYAIMKAQAETEVQIPLFSLGEINRTVNSSADNLIPFLKEVHSISRAFNPSNILDSDNEVFPVFDRDSGMYDKGQYRITKALLDLGGIRYSKADPGYAARSLNAIKNR